MSISVNRRKNDRARLPVHLHTRNELSLLALTEEITLYVFCCLQVIQERTAWGLVSVTRVKYHAPDKEERMERGRKIDLLLQENIRREKERKEAEKRRQQKEEEEEKLRR